MGSNGTLNGWYARLCHLSQTSQGEWRPCSGLKVHLTVGKTITERSVGRGMIWFVCLMQWQCDIRTEHTHIYCVIEEMRILFSCKSDLMLSVSYQKTGHLFIVYFNPMHYPAAHYRCWFLVVFTCPSTVPSLVHKSQFAAAKYCLHGATYSYNPRRLSAPLEPRLSSSPSS